MFSFRASQITTASIFKGKSGQRHLGKDYEYDPGKGSLGYKSNSFVNNRGRTKADDRSRI